MTSSSDKPISAIRISPESARVLEASIAAGTSGPGFWLLQIALTTLAAILLVASVGVALFAGGAFFAGEAGAWQIAGASLLFALPLAIFLTIQIPFLKRVCTGG